MAIDVMVWLAELDAAETVDQSSFVIYDLATVHLYIQSPGVQIQLLGALLKAVSEMPREQTVQKQTGEHMQTEHAPPARSGIFC